MVLGIILVRIQEILRRIHVRINGILVKNSSMKLSCLASASVV